MNDIQALIGLVSDQVGELAQSDVVLGDPIVLGEVTLVPLSRVSVGFGAGGGTGEADPGRKGHRPRGQGSWLRGPRRRRRRYRLRRWARRRECQQRD